MANPTTNSNVTRSIAQTSQYVQEMWTKEIEQPFDKLLQFAKLVQDRSGLVAPGGDIIRVPFTAGIDARAKSASTDVTFDSPEGAPIAINIDKHYYAAMKVEKIAETQSNYDLRSAFQLRLAEALARQIDTDLHALYASAGTSVAGGAAIDDADILAVVAALDAANTPMSGRRGIVGHYTKQDLLGVNKYNAYDQTGKTGTAVNGMGESLIANVYGMDLYHSGNVPTSTTGRNLFFHKDAITKAVQQKPTVVVEERAASLATEVVMHTIYGIGVERAASVIELTRTTAP